MNFEDKPSKLQNLTFEEAQSYCAFLYNNFLNNVDGLIEPESGLYTNLALLLSDQNPYFIFVSTFTDKDLTIPDLKKEINGCILSQAATAYNFVNAINHSIRLENENNDDNSGFPKAAVFEAILNAIIHRDYSYNGPILIKINDEKLQVTNIGSLTQNIHQDDLFVGIHIPRNPKLVSIFKQLGITHASGTGIDKIFSSYNNQNVQPYIETTPNVFQLNLPNRAAEVSSLEDSFLKRKDLKLTPSQKQIINTLNSKRSINKKELKVRTGLKQSTYYKALNVLLKEGLIIQKTNNGEKIIEITDLGKK